MTPPIQPTPPDEPVNIWAPTGPAPGHPAVPPPVYPSNPYPPPPPPRSARVGLRIATTLGVLVLLAMCARLFVTPTAGDSLVAVDTTTTTPTTTTPPKPFAVVGDCAKVTGASFNIKYDKVSCEGGLHNYTVSKVLASQSEKCGDEPDTYTKYMGHVGSKSVNLCLIPVFVEGQCYDLMFTSLDAELKKMECGGYPSVRAKIFANTVDKAVCGPSPALALAYPETRTTYCFTQAF
ncbi:hypothetical protein [Lentzea sp. NPDC051838]|uniref:LppU/SCO3897 family protein n=1 Tax=Lentzea sp. NPDC051838 TaxID=3154849 RepID=UPI0034148333